MVRRRRKQTWLIDIPQLSDEQFAKLPKWAQQHFKSLQRLAEDMHEDLERFYGKYSESDMMIVTFAGDQFVPPHSHVRILLDDNRHVDIHKHDNTIRIYGNDRLAIMPSAANTVGIEVEPPWRNK